MYFIFYCDMWYLQNARTTNCEFDKFDKLYSKLNESFSTQSDQTKLNWANAMYTIDG